jgi:hypothetical protein
VFFRRRRWQESRSPGSARYKPYHAALQDLPEIERVEAEVRHLAVDVVGKLRDFDRPVAVDVGMVQRDEQAGVLATLRLLH